MSAINLIKSSPALGSSGVVSQYVLKELSRHYVMPQIADSMAHCLRPDIAQLVHKVWKHAPHLEMLEGVLRQALDAEWECDPYALSTRFLLSTLAWAGAAVIETGQRQGANLSIGNVFFNICDKDRALTLLLVLCAYQHSDLIRTIVSNGPPFLLAMCTSAPPVFC